MSWRSSTLRQQSGLNMRSLLPHRWKHLLWKDELGDEFLLLKFGEVCRYGRTTLRAYIWSHTKAVRVQNLGGKLKIKTDDGLFIVDFPHDLLASVIRLGAFRRRPPKRGRWIQDKEERLGHRILPFNPALAQLRSLRNACWQFGG